MKGLNMTDKQYPSMSNVQTPIELLGIPNCFSALCQFDSSPRKNMLQHHLPQTMIIDEPEFPKLFTGFENKLGKYSINPSQREHDCEVVAIIPKYTPQVIQQWQKNCPRNYVIVLSIDDKTGERTLDYFTIDRYFMGNNNFGWIPVIEDDGLRKIKPGEFLPKETVVTHSPAVQGEKYCLGTNLNTILGSFPETIEDAFIISESAARKLGTQQVSQAIIDVRMDRHPLNLNGDQYTDKFLPDIGSYVQPDGALCAFRPVHWATYVADTDPESLRQPLPLQDDIIYIEPGSKIVDLTFNINTSKPNNCYEQARRYMMDNNECWKAIYSVYMKYKGKYKLSNKMWTLVRDSIYRMIAQNAKAPILDDQFRRLARNFDLEGINNKLVDFMQVIVTYTVPRPVSNGDKLTDLHGSRHLDA